jgi:cytochrome c-type biogenesis protein CcmH/NrfF
MPKWKISVLVVLLAGLTLAQNSSGIMSRSVRRVGAKLACLCGGCKNTVGDCPMLQCHYASPTREKISALQAEGKADSSVVDAIVAENGKQALAVPPQEGFALLAWTMPYVAVFLGLIAIWAFVRRFSARRHPAPQVDPAVLERYHDRIEKDLAKLD